MADTTFHLEIITPEKVLVTDDVDSLEAPGTAGEFQILAEHTPFLTDLGIGAITYVKGGKKQYVSISGGFCEVQPQKTLILAHTAESSHEIDEERATEASKRARERLESKDSSIDLARAQASLERAVNRLNVSSME